MKKNALQVVNYDYILDELNGQPVGLSINAFAAANGPTWWKEEGADGKPNLCTEIDDAAVPVTAVVNDGHAPFPLTSVDFEECTIADPCPDEFIGTRPPRY